MPVFRFDKDFVGIARGVKALLRPRGDTSRNATLAMEQRKEQAGLREKIESKRQELRRIRSEHRAAKKPAERIEHRRRRKKAQQELFQLESELRAAKERAEGTPAGRPAPRAAGEPATGALPDFIILGATKCGTTSLYHLLAQHPLVEPAATKELHYFDTLVDEGIEWYRRCFPAPRRWEDGRKTITGEATPDYLFDPLTPERMAEAIPQARLIALLRNPVNRAYSQYRHLVRAGRETRTFEEAVEAEMARLLLDEGSEQPPEGEAHAGLADEEIRRGYLSRGVYVDQLVRWSRFFGREQMLVLKSEDFFERPSETLKPVLGFLGLPAWEPRAWEARNRGTYEQGMDPVTRWRLKRFFGPHNERLYEYLGTDFGW